MSEKFDRMELVLGLIGEMLIDGEKNGVWLSAMVVKRFREGDPREQKIYPNLIKSLDRTGREFTVEW